MINLIYDAKFCVANHKVASIILLVVSYLAFIVGYLFVFNNGGGIWLKPPVWILKVDVATSTMALYILTRIIISGLKMKV